MSDSSEPVSFIDSLSERCPLREAKEPQKAQEWAFSRHEPGQDPTVGLTDQDLALGCLFNHRRGACEVPVTIRTEATT